MPPPQRIPAPAPPGRRPVAWSRRGRLHRRRPHAGRPSSKSPGRVCRVRTRRSSPRSAPLCAPPRSRCTADPGTAPVPAAHGGVRTGWHRSCLRYRGSRIRPESAPRAHRPVRRPHHYRSHSRRRPPSASPPWRGGRTRPPAMPRPPTGRRRRDRCTCPPVRFAPSPADRAPGATGHPRWSNPHRGTADSTSAPHRRRAPRDATPWGCHRSTVRRVWRSHRRYRHRTSARSSL